MQQEKAKQDDGLSDLSDILGDLKSMAVDMGSELDKSDKHIYTYFHAFVYTYVCKILNIVGKFAGKTRLLIISMMILMNLTLVLKELIHEHVTCFPNKKTPLQQNYLLICILLLIPIFSFLLLKFPSFFILCYKICQY